MWKIKPTCDPAPPTVPALLNPHPKKNPRTSGASPMRGLWSAVKDSGGKIRLLPKAEFRATTVTRPPSQQNFFFSPDRLNNCIHTWCDGN